MCGWQSANPPPQHRCSLGRYSCRGNGGRLGPSGRPRDDLTRNGTRNEKACGAVVESGLKFFTAMNGAGSEHQLVPNEHDAARNLSRMGSEFLRRATTEIDDFGSEPF